MTQWLYIYLYLIYNWTSQVVQLWRIHLLMQETQEMQIPPLGQEDILEEKMAT